MEKPFREHVELETDNADVRTPQASEEQSFEDTKEPQVTAKTWFVVFLLSQGYGLSFIPIPVMAAIGTSIATDFGEVSKSNWFVSTWMVTITISFMMVGTNTDILGRRYFLVAGNFICAVGHLVVGCAKNNETIIAGMAVIGFGAANCQLAAYALPELLPNKWRHIGVVIADAFVFVATTIFPVTARYGYFAGSWRANYWAAAGAQFVSFLGLLFYYFPPAHPLGLPYGVALRELDYIGMALFAAGATPFMMGIVWASVYPSDDPHVVAPLVVGLAIIAVFALWETYGNIKHPLTPTDMFVASWGRDFTAPCIVLSILNMSYYGSSIIWPTMIAEFYTEASDWKRAALLSVPQGLALTFGAALLMIFGSKIRHWQHQQTAAVFVMVLFSGLMALGTPNNLGMMIAFVFLSLAGTGWGIYLCIAICQMGVEQERLGSAGGLAGCVRFAGGTIAQAVYMAIFNQQVAKYTAEYVPAAAKAAGLPTSQVTRLLGMVGTPQLEKTFDEAIVVAVQGAVQHAYERGIQGIAYASVAFGVVCLIACLCCKDVDAKMTNKIEIYLENTENAKKNKYH